MTDISLSGGLVDSDEIANVFSATDGALGSRLPTPDELGMFVQLLRQFQGFVRALWRKGAN